MTELPQEFIVFDLEYTAWEGSMERDWNGSGEEREIYDIGAARVGRDSFTVIDEYTKLVSLELTEELPAYSTGLTGVTQEALDTGSIPFRQMITEFKSFTGDLFIYAWGTDGDVVAENCELKKVTNPFAKDQFRDIREVFAAHDVPTAKYKSSTIVKYFGEQNTRTAHRGLDDALNIVDALRLLETKLAKSGK